MIVSRINEREELSEFGVRCRSVSWRLSSEGFLLPDMFSGEDEI